MYSKIEIPLDIENIRVKQVTFTKEDNILIKVESTEEGAYCYRCGNRITKLHSHNRELKLRHLAILGKKTYLLIAPKRYECDSCPNHPTTTQILSWYQPKSHYTKAYEQHLLLLLKNSTITDVSHKEELGWDALEGLMNRLIGKEINWVTINTLKTIGIDEIALKKGHGDFVTLITLQHDNGRLQLLSILENRKKETVKNFFLSIPNHLRDTIENVCTDLYDGYINAAREVFGDKINIIADRFHVARLYHKSVDELRKKEMRRLKKELSPEEYLSLKNVMWILRKKPEKLLAEEKETRKKLFDHSPELKCAYLLSITLTAIFDSKLSSANAQVKLKELMTIVQNNNLSFFNTFVNTLSCYLIQITNYFIARKNSGFVEGLNNKVKVIKRRCYGIFNRSHLFQRVTLDLAEYGQFV
jgi:transposase